MTQDRSQAANDYMEVVTANDGYRALLELGRGGMARVYLAEKTTRGLRRLLVLKVLDPSLASDPEMRAAFRREAEVCARLNHPNIVQVFEVIEQTSCPMMVMEYLEGVSLSQVVSRSEGRLPLRLQVHALMQVLAGLHYFHELRDADGAPLHPVHRDISPQNILVLHEGAVKVLDFGIAKLRDQSHADATRAGIIKGKLSYMCAEQLVGDASIDRRADLFSVGVILWEAFARRRMWEGWSQQEMAKALVAGDIPSIREACPDITPAWEDLIMKSVAGSRDDRFDTALDMQLAMERLLPEIGGAAGQREVAEFMEREFGEWRRARQKLVDSESRKHGAPLAHVLGDVPESQVIEIRQVGESSLSELAPLSSSGISQSAPLLAPPELPAPSRKRAAPLLIAAAVAVLGLGGYLWSRGSAAPAPTAAAPQSISLQVIAAPPEATITLDGKPVGPNPWSASLAPESRNARIEVSAPGHETFSQLVSMREGARLTVRLKPIAAPPSPETSEREAPAELEAKSVTKPRAAGHFRAAPASPRAAAAPAASPAAAPAANCSPPYVLDAQGVKTYKPECL